MNKLPKSLYLDVVKFLKVNGPSKVSKNQDTGIIEQITSFSIENTKGKIEKYTLYLTLPLDLNV